MIQRHILPILIRDFDKRTPILFYSGAGYAHDTKDALDAGAQECLINPVEAQNIRQAVARLVSRLDSG